MRTAPSWTEMNTEEKLEVLRKEMRAMAKSFDELRRRMEEIERRFEELFFR